MGNDSDKQDRSAEESRRRFLEKAGKLAIYTPPAMLLMMHPNRQAIAHSPHGDNGVGNGPDQLPPGIQSNGKHFLDNDDHGGVPGGPQNQGGFN